MVGHGAVVDALHEAEVVLVVLVLVLVLVLGDEVAAGAQLR